MRKLLLLAALVAAGVVLGRRMRAARAAPPGPAPPAPAPATRPAPLRDPEPVPTAPPRPTTNGERVVLMSISMLEERGEAATVEAVVRHVAAGELDPDEGAVDVLLHRLAELGCLSQGAEDGPYRLTATGLAALADGSTARHSPVGDVADELSSPATGDS